MDLADFEGVGLWLNIFFLARRLPVIEHRIHTFEKLEVTELDRNFYRKVFYEKMGSVDQILYYRLDWLATFRSADIDIYSVDRDYESWVEALSDILSHADCS